MRSNIPFIQPADIGGALSGFADTLNKRSDARREQVEEQRKQGIRQDLSRDLEEENYENIYKTMAVEPWAVDEFKKVDKFKNDKTKKARGDALLKILMGGEATPAIAELVGVIHTEGGTVEDTAVVGNNAMQADKAKAAGNIEEKAKYDKKVMDAVEFEYSKMFGVDKMLKLRKARSGGIGVDGKEKKEYSPSPLKKSINERQEYIDAGMSEDDPIMQAYDKVITGVDKSPLIFTPKQLDLLGVLYSKTGKVPSLGRGQAATRAKQEVVARGAAYQLREEGFGEYVDKGIESGMSPVDAAMSMLGDITDTKAIQGSLNFLDKQLSSMGSFVTNLNSQVDKVHELSKDLKTFDTRLLNIPLRKLRGRLRGSPIQAKYDMYLTEIESEIGKLATGSTGSVSELSVGAQEKWSFIHDKNLSVQGMMELLEETKKAANFRVESVQGQLNKTRARMRSENRDFKQEKATSDPLGIR